MSEVIKKVITPQARCSLSEWLLIFNLIIVHPDLPRWCLVTALGGGWRVSAPTSTTATTATAGARPPGAASRTCSNFGQWNVSYPKTIYDGLHSLLLCLTEILFLENWIYWSEFVLTIIDWPIKIRSPIDSKMHSKSCAVPWGSKIILWLCLRLSRHCI